MTDVLYAPVHHCQYDSPVPITRQSGCTWTSLAMGVDASTGGRLDPTPDQVHALVRNDEETNPGTPGWSMHDAQKAMRRLGIPYDDRSGDGWAALVAWLMAGHGVTCQGDSDRFGNNTCSGSYDGPHCIYIHPVHRPVDGERQWWIFDPICRAARWERESVLKAYATKLATAANFGVFAQPVPAIEPQPVNPAPGKGEANVSIRYATAVRSTTRLPLAKGQICYASPGGRAVTRMSKAAKVPHIGLAGKAGGKAWRAVLIGTAASYPDGKPHATVLYVPASVGKVVPA